MKKIGHLPLKPYVYKYIKDELVNGTLVYKHRVFCSDNRKNADLYFARMNSAEVDSVTIKVEMHGCNEFKMFAIATQIESEFRQKLYMYVNAQVEAGTKTVRESIREFLDRYEIEDHELSLETMYRNYNRRRKDPSNRMGGSVNRPLLFER